MECQAAEKRTKRRFEEKEKWFKENWNLEYKPRIDEKNKINLQQHKDLESGSTKPNKIPRDFFKLRKRRSEEETNRNIRSSSERLNITNYPLLPILTSSETEREWRYRRTNRSWFFTGTLKSHKRDMMSSKPVKTKKLKKQKSS